MKVQKFAVIVWAIAEDVADEQSAAGRGVVYGWYESLATALNTATNLVQNGSFGHAVAMKML